MSLSAVQANGMSLQMEKAASLMGAMPEGCRDCPDSGVKAMTCGAVCAVPVLAVLPANGAAEPALRESLPVPAYAPVPHGRRTAPDPHPPPRADIA